MTVKQVTEEAKIFLWLLDEQFHANIYRAVRVKIFQPHSRQLPKTAANPHLRLDEEDGYSRHQILGIQTCGHFYNKIIGDAIKFIVNSYLGLGLIGLGTPCPQSRHGSTSIRD